MTASITHNSPSFPEATVDLILDIDAELIVPGTRYGDRFSQGQTGRYIIVFKWDLMLSYKHTKYEIFLDLLQIPMHINVLANFNFIYF